MEPAEALDRMGLGRLAHERASGLSAGQSRRLALACLLLRHRPLWILDEPLNALDVDGVAIVQRILADHLSDGGLLVLTSHLPVTGLRTRLCTLPLAA